ncbi:FAD-binding oxidoreductase [Blastococcus sp. Marseille-P5729]|uniref:NAD(P)/FAD-dependent oxidoreductase n=1 Tax=Blastococcus sp. Marseille-P5729 TaxID=2086582 RepID=UPI000D0EA20F|nr:FAD-dependent oxidoreductase [Blastococcus sp. Marseille-P5729]
METFDAIVIGGGIAGVSLAYELASDRRVGLLEMETHLAFHTTGRSAATFLETYGGDQIRALTTGSRDFFENPPSFLDHSPLRPLGLVWVATHGRGARLQQMHAEMCALVPDAQLLSPEEAVQVNPILKGEYIEQAMLEPGAMELDVHLLHQGFVTGFRERGGIVHTAARVTGAVRSEDFDEDHVWTLTDSGDNKYRAPLVVNAAGSWVDVVAATFGARSVGIAPLRRTIFMVPSPQGSRTASLPMAADVDDTFYVKPDGEQYLCSPADEVLQSPSDPRPDELRIAQAMEVIDEATHIAPRHVRSSWAGLRNFTPDRQPVVGFDPRVAGFFWFGGQGGYGIQTAPSMARLGAALARGEQPPADLVARGLDVARLDPARFMG